MYMWAVICLLTVLSATSYADMYLKYVDENGVVHYTDVGSRPALGAKAKKASFTVPSGRFDYADNYHDIIAKYAEKHSLDPKLVKAVIKAESNFDPGAVSRKGAMGLMQLMPSTAYLMGVENPFSPEDNIDGGSRYLKHLLDRYNGDVKLALAAYNAGPKTVEKYGSVPPITETRNYVNKIVAMYKGNGGSTTAGKAASSRTSQPSSQQTNQIVYKIVLEDGTILLTNSRYR